MMIGKPQIVSVFNYIWMWHTLIGGWSIIIAPSNTYCGLQVYDLRQRCCSPGRCD